MVKKEENTENVSGKAQEKVDPIPENPADAIARLNAEVAALQIKVRDAEGALARANKSTPATFQNGITQGLSQFHALASPVLARIKALNEPQHMGHLRADDQTHYENLHVAATTLVKLVEALG